MVLKINSTGVEIENAIAITRTVQPLKRTVGNAGLRVTVTEGLGTHRIGFSIVWFELPRGQQIDRVPREKAVVEKIGTLCLVVWKTN
ncbi:MAG: hypothetical protein Fur006_33960 [Coleofasciculaceae cyanobacterium]